VCCFVIVFCCVEAYIYWEYLDLRHSLGLDAIRRVFSLYEATKAPTRCFGASIVRL
jgi:hypothetical protein